MKLLIIYLVVGLILIGIDMTVFIFADTLDKPEYTSIGDVIVLLLFAVDIPFMFFTSLLGAVANIFWTLLFASPRTGSPLLLHSSGTTLFLFHLAVDVVGYLILAAVFHVCFYLPGRFALKVFRSAA